MDETKSEPPKIKVVDRRKFTVEGDPVDTAEPAVETAVPEMPPEEGVVDPAPSTPEPAPAAQSRETPDQLSAQFLELVTMLASQAELLLVGAEDLPAQPAEGQRLIDYLGVLEEKTAGNLSADEAKILSTVLYQLRTFFLQSK